ncbi:MAG: hypothetical protein HON55_01700 [Legionellales bacterium]|jgi:predicted enzyme related to lactoylglutathione lyase|nr:hypothetical protein [Legionellales bacterium]
MISSMCDNAATINSNSNNFIDIPQIPLGSTITNLVVKSMESSVAFYNNVMDMDIVQSSSRCIVLTNGSMTICLTTKEHANDIFGFSMPAIYSSGRAEVTATLICEDVWAIWGAAMAFGATSIQQPVTSDNNVTSAILQDPNNYTIVLKSKAELLQ